MKATSKKGIERGLAALLLAALIAATPAAAQSPSQVVDGLASQVIGILKNTALDSQQKRTQIENIAYNAGRDAFYEWGPSNVAFGHGAFGSTHHGATPNNPYNVMLSGANLGDDSGTSGSTTDAVCGFQFSLGNIAAPAYAGWFSVIDPGAD